MHLVGYFRKTKVYTRLTIYIVQFQLIRDTSRQQLG